MSEPTIQNKPNLKIISTLAVLAVVSCLGMYFRLYPLLNYQPHESKEKATVYVLTNIKTKIALDVAKSQPHLNDQEKNMLVKRLFDDFLKNQSDKVRHSIDIAARNLSQQDQSSSKFPYLLASDSFHYYYLTKNILATGRMAQDYKGSKYFHPLMMAPLGFWEPVTWHPLVGALTYKLLKIAQPDIPLMAAVSFTSLILAFLCLCAFLFVCRILQFSVLPTLTGSIFFFLSPIFIKRSMFGWYDNDPYSVFFPLILIGLSCKAVNYIKSFKSNIFYATLISVCLIAYAHFWQGWVLLLSILIISMLFILIYNHFVFKNIEQSKSFASLTAFILLGSFLGITVMFGKDEFFTLFAEGYKALQNFLSPQLSLWPDLFISVAELKKASLSFIAEMMGGWLFCGISLLGLLYSILRSVKRPSLINPFHIIVIGTFFFATLYITKGAQRFVLLCLIPSSLLFVYGLECLSLVLQQALPRTFIKNPNSKSIPIIAGIFIVSLSIPPIMSTPPQLEALLNPIYNDTWHKVMTKIKEETPQDSIVNAWWPPGHFIKSMAGRSVSFDGATINTPQAYWLSNIFLSQNEQEALGILKMINSSANQSSDYLQSIGFSLTETIQLLKLITPLDNVAALKKLSPLLKDHNKIRHLLNLTHGAPPPSYILVYNEFMQNNLQLKFIGSWNFKIIEGINRDPKLIKKVPKRNSDEYVQFLWKLAGGPYKYSEPLIQINSLNNKIMLTENLMIDLVNFEVQIDSNKYGRGIPHSIIYIKDGIYQEKMMPDRSLSYSVVLTKSGNQYQARLMDPPLARSILVRLFYFNGAGLKYFKPFAREADLSKRTEIAVFEVIWDHFKKDFD